jgi:hypothetical protein|tara:strand:+ start:94 stop:288 length:195 start_codon:yes stop_codon:yes gene_type:complete
MGKSGGLDGASADGTLKACMDRQRAGFWWLPKILSAFTGIPETFLDNSSVTKHSFFDCNYFRQH